jgi:VanZ family protein
MENNNNFFTDKASIKTIDRKRIIYFLIAVLFFFLTEIGRNIYRPYIYTNNIDDYGIADSIGNSGGIIVQIFFMLTILNSPRKKVFRVIGFIVIGYILYEILQPYLPRGVFDWKDIYGTLIGGVISLFVWLFVKKIVKNKVIYEFK